MSSTWKAALGTTIALVVLIGLLFVTGVVRIGSLEEDSEGGEEEAESGDDAPVERRKGKRGKGKGKHGKSKGKRGKGKGKRSSDLESLGYVGAVEMRPEDRGKVGVTTHVRDKVAAGLNLFNPCAWGKKYVEASGGKILRESQLIDMDGKVLHRWETTFGSNTTRGWEIARLSDDGFLYAVNARSGFVKLDWDSNIVWGLEGGYHHDFAFGPDGNLWVLYEKKLEVTHDGMTGVIWDNGFAVVSPDGQLVKELPFYEKVKDHPIVAGSLDTRMRARATMAKEAEAEDEDEDTPLKQKPIDLFHSNTVEFAGADVEGLWKKGDLITAMRDLDMIVVFDASTMEVRWTWGPDDLDRPHDPTVLQNGHMLLLDNGMRRGFSRVLEIDPRNAAETVWAYRGTKANPFYSPYRGLVQLLSNDNILVSSSHESRAFEIDRDGNIVWEFWSTYVLDENLRAPIRLVRLEGKALEFAQQKLADAG